MDIFQKLNMERGITVVLITHEMDIAEHGTRIVKFRDGRIQIDQQITNRRMAGEELKDLPAADDDTSHLPASVVQAQQPAQPPASH
jgi:putative ABC transport system ATP-binding protein